MGYFNNRRIAKVKSQCVDNVGVIAHWNDEYRWCYRQPNGRVYAVSPLLEVWDLDDCKIPSSCTLTSTFSFRSRRGERWIDKLTRAVQFMNHYKWEGNWEIPVYRVHGITWHIRKDSLDTPNVFKLYPYREGENLSWIHVPMQLVCEMRSSYQLEFHPYTMRPHSRVPLIDCTAHTYIPPLQLTHIEDVTKAAFNMLVDVGGMPGLKDHHCMQVVFDITKLDNSGTPVFDLKEVLEAVKQMEHESKDWSIDINKVMVRFGHNPQPIKIEELVKVVPNHRFYCSDTPVRNNCETYIANHSVPTSYP